MCNGFLFAIAAWLILCDRDGANAAGCGCGGSHAGGCQSNNTTSGCGCGGTERVRVVSGCGNGGCGCGCGN